MTIKKEIVIVLDLDDTLYKEVAYQKSGLDAVLRYLEDIYGKSVLDFSKQLNLNLDGDWIGELCVELNLAPSLKESLLWIYRLHRPSITLDIDIKNTLHLLSKKSILSILTDGRSITQRQKINALGLSHLPIYISDEYGASKPSTLGFEIIMQDFPEKKYYYVGDNLLKDFIAPNHLGWTTICLLDNGSNIHRQINVKPSASQLPSIWIANLSELLTHIC